MSVFLFIDALVMLITSHWSSQNSIELEVYVFQLIIVDCRSFMMKKIHVFLLKRFLPCNRDIQKISFHF